VTCDAAAVTGWRRSELKLISVAGAGTAIKAVAAGLHKGSGVHWELEDCGDIPSWTKWKARGKWQCFRSHLGLGCYHLVAWTREAGFLPTVSPEALRRQLISVEITTPILTTREWLAYIHRRLKEESLWTDYTCFGCRCADVRLSSEILDKIVSDGIMSGVLSFV